MKILICVNKHHFVTEKCPHCNSPAVGEVEYREGDCVACGALCPEYALGCNSPAPIVTEKNVVTA